MGFREYVRYRRAQVDSDSPVSQVLYPPLMMVFGAIKYSVQMFTTAIEQLRAVPQIQQYAALAVQSLDPFLNMPHLFTEEQSQTIWDTLRDTWSSIRQAGWVVFSVFDQSADEMLRTQRAETA